MESPEHESVHPSLEGHPEEFIAEMQAKVCSPNVLTKMSFTSIFFQKFLASEQSLAKKNFNFMKTFKYYLDHDDSGWFCHSLLGHAVFIASTKPDLPKGGSPNEVSYGDVVSSLQAGLARLLLLPPRLIIANSIMANMKPDIVSLLLVRNTKTKTLARVALIMTDRDVAKCRYSLFYIGKAVEKISQGVPTYATHPKMFKNLYDVCKVDRPPAVNASHFPELVPPHAKAPMAIAKNANPGWECDNKTCALPSCTKRHPLPTPGEKYCNKGLACVKIFCGKCPGCSEEQDCTGNKCARIHLDNVSWYDCPNPKCLATSGCKFRHRKAQVEPYCNLGFDCAQRLCGKCGPCKSGCVHARLCVGEHNKLKHYKAGSPCPENCASPLCVYAHPNRAGSATEALKQAQPAAPAQASVKSPLPERKIQVVPGSVTSPKAPGREPSAAVLVKSPETQRKALAVAPPVLVVVPVAPVAVVKPPAQPPAKAKKNKKDKKMEVLPPVAEEISTPAGVVQAPFSPPTSRSAGKAQASNLGSSAAGPSERQTSQSRSVIPPPPKSHAAVQARLAYEDKADQFQEHFDKVEADLGEPVGPVNAVKVKKGKNKVGPTGTRLKGFKTAVEPNPMPVDGPSLPRKVIVADLRDVKFLPVVPDDTMLDPVVLKSAGDNNRVKSKVCEYLGMSGFPEFTPFSPLSSSGVSIFPPGDSKKLFFGEDEISVAETDDLIVFSRTKTDGVTERVTETKHFPRVITPLSYGINKYSAKLYLDTMEATAAGTYKHSLVSTTIKQTCTNGMKGDGYDMFEPRSKVFFIFGDVPADAYDGNVVTTVKGLADAVSGSQTCSFMIDCIVVCLKTYRTDKASGTADLKKDMATLNNVLSSAYKKNLLAIANSEEEVYANVPKLDNSYVPVPLYVPGSISDISELTYLMSAASTVRGVSEHRNKLLTKILSKSHGTSIIGEKERESLIAAGYNANSAYYMSGSYTHDSGRVTGGLFSVLTNGTQLLVQSHEMDIVPLAAVSRPPRYWLAIRKMPEWLAKLKATYPGCFVTVDGTDMMVPILSDIVSMISISYFKSGSLGYIYPSSVLVDKSLSSGQKAITKAFRNIYEKKVTKQEVTGNKMYSFTDPSTNQKLEVPLFGFYKGKPVPKAITLPFVHVAIVSSTNAVARLYVNQTLLDE